MMWGSMQQTAELSDTQLLVAVDADDTSLADYLKLPQTNTAVRRYGMSVDEPWLTVLQPDETGNMTRAMNSATAPFMDRDLIIGMVNDDHRFRTPGWDKRVTEALRTPGIAYGDDLFQGEALVCGGVFISAPIVRALGWYCLPTCDHLFVDNAWGVLGKTMDRLHYLPDVVIEHLHPMAGKGEWDAGYEAANNQATVDHDRIAYETWRDGGQMRRDVARVERALAVAA
jgi:hypothetical protein